MIDKEKEQHIVFGNTSTNNNEEINENVEQSQYEVNIPLPSLGVSYIGPNHLKETIAIRPLDWRDEDTLTTQSYIEDDIVLDKILDNVILDKTLKRPMLAPVDKETILYWLRSQEFGPVVEIPSKCPICSQKTLVKWDLEKIEIPRYDDEVLQELIKNNGEYLIITPITKLKILLKVPTVAEVENFKQRVLKQRKNKGEEKISSELLKTMISGIIITENEQEVVIRKKEQLFSYFDKAKLKLSEIRYIREQYEKINLKYNTEQNITCEHCGYIQEGVELPTNHKNFFWLNM